MWCRMPLVGSGFLKKVVILSICYKTINLIVRAAVKPCFEGGNRRNHHAAKIAAGLRISGLIDASLSCGGDLVRELYFAVIRKALMLQRASCRRAGSWYPNMGFFWYAWKRKWRAGKTIPTAPWRIAAISEKLTNAHNKNNIYYLQTLQRNKKLMFSV